MTVTCIIPAYNEESSVKKTIAMMRGVASVDEILVVDDGSTDKTCVKAAEMGVTVLRHTKNRGKGAAIKTGLMNASGDVILLIDADITAIDVDKVEEMICLVSSKRADVVIGTFDFSCFQTFTEIVYKPLMGLLFPEVLRKIKKGHLSGQRVFSREMIDRLSLSDGYDMETKMNIDLAFMRPSPRIKFVHLGKIELRIKGYQKGMEAIANCILTLSQEHDRMQRLRDSSFLKASQSLSVIVKKNCALNDPLHNE